MKARHLGLGLMGLALGLASGCSAGIGEALGETETELSGVAGSSLVANWRLDESGCGTTVNDASGNGATGSKYNGVSSGKGRIGLAAWFDGVDDSIEFSHRAAFNFSNAMTVSAWVHADSVDGSRTIVNKWYAMDSYMLSIQAGRFTYSIATPGGEWGTTYDVSAPAVAKTWTHVAGVFNGSQIMIYVNGKLSGTTSVPAGTTLQQSSRPVVIGNHPSWNAYKGYIDEVRLYNKALSTAQVAALATQATPTPVGYWRMEECSGTSVLDATGQGRTGTKQNGAGTSATGIGMAASFDGDDDQIEIPDNPAFHMTKAVTVSAWAYPHSLAGGHGIINKWYALDSYQLGLQDGKFTFSIATPGGGQWGTAYNVSAPAVANAWTHVAGVFDGSAISLYLNGRLSAVTAVPRGTVLQQSDRPLAIGNHPSWAAFDGYIDEVRLYDSALSSTQLSALADPAYGW